MVDILTYRQSIGCFNQIYSQRGSKPKLPKNDMEQYIPVFQKYVKVVVYFILVSAFFMCLGTVFSLEDYSTYVVCKRSSKRGQIFSNYNLFSPTDSTLLPKINVVYSKFYHFSTLSEVEFDSSDVKRK